MLAVELVLLVLYVYLFNPIHHGPKLLQQLFNPLKCV